MMAKYVDNILDSHIDILKSIKKLIINSWQSNTYFSQNNFLFNKRKINQQVFNIFKQNAACYILKQILLIKLHLGLRAS